MANNFKNTEDAFKIFGDKVIHRARLYLRKRKNKKGYTTNTKKSTLSNSLNFNVKVYPSGSLEMDFNAVDYMPYVEEGRKPGKMPPTSAIVEWIKIKPLKLRDSKTGKFKAKTKANINSAAFGIAMSIKEYGIEPTYDKMIQLSLYKQLIESKFDKKLDLISGGSSITLPLVKKKFPKSISLVMGVKNLLDVTSVNQVISGGATHGSGNLGDRGRCRDARYVFGDVLRHGGRGVGGFLRRRQRSQRSEARLARGQAGGAQTDRHSER